MNAENKARYLAATKKLKESVEVDPLRMGGRRPVLKGTRFPFAQVVQEIADGRSAKEVADDYDQSLELITEALEGFSILIDINRLEPFDGNWQIVDGLEYARELKYEMLKKFKRSDFFKALEKHLVSEECTLIKKPGHVLCYKGTGYGIRILDVGMRYEGGEAVIFDIDIEVDFYDNYDDPPYGSIHTDIPSNPTDERYKFLLPEDLVTDFYQHKFDDWVKVQVYEKNAERLSRIEDYLKTIGKKVVNLSS